MWANNAATSTSKTRFKTGTGAPIIEGLTRTVEAWGSTVSALRTHRGKDAAACLKASLRGIAEYIMQ